jgi:hypothetical protein
MSPSLETNPARIPEADPFLFAENLNRRIALSTDDQKKKVFHQLYNSKTQNFDTPSALSCLENKKRTHKIGTVILCWMELSAAGGS